ncbi:hypothetical protein Leryth_004189 [Lithospermum erythrorhizon]|nr:hypothetical protein Leryth_004189 [Lithospermum erythrorhizon]
MQFLNARPQCKNKIPGGRSSASVDREIFKPRVPPRVEYPHTEFKRIEDRSTLTMSLWQVKPVQKCYKITREYQIHLKNLAHRRETRCTTFDAMTDMTKLSNPPLKDGFYGNAVCVAWPKMLEFGGKLTITQWTRFSIYEKADFGWGRPVYAGPIDLTPTPQVCVFLPAGGGGVDSESMVVCICLPEYATNKFKEFFYLK